MWLFRFWTSDPTGLSHESGGNSAQKITTKSPGESFDPFSNIQWSFLIAENGNIILICQSVLGNILENLSFHCARVTTCWGWNWATLSRTCGIGTLLRAHWDRGCCSRNRSMAVNLSKNGAALMAAYNEVVDAKSDTNWWVVVWWFKHSSFPLLSVNLTVCNTTYKTLINPLLSQLKRRSFIRANMVYCDQTMWQITTYHFLCVCNVFFFFTPLSFEVCNFNHMSMFRQMAVSGSNFPSLWNCCCVCLQGPVHLWRKQQWHSPGWEGR